MARLSGLQKDVLHLYRQCIRTVYKKPKESQDNFRQLARSQFYHYRTLPKKEFATIEHLLRKGRRMLELYENPNVRNVSA
ncbi:succinate dehydrogenase assembly factor 1, mitochondrial [Trichomonascus vanleenenianus]|uniref:Sdh6p n=1 Tax=Trichomonascus vanleenenianus TaxID=2268995 RepID=UPI003ECA6675